MGMNKIIKSILVATAVSLGWNAWAVIPKNVILFIGDGMSMPQRMLAEEFSRKVGMGPLAMNHLPYTASTRSCSANSLVTDSAAAATAIACGVKTYNGGMGVDENGVRALSCAELAHQTGRKVGIATTVTITHATPAGFYAHRDSRGDLKGIAQDLADSGFELFAGGGFSMTNEAPYAYAQEKGYTIISNRSDFMSLTSLEGRKILTRFTDFKLDYQIDATPTNNQPTLAEITRQAIRLLDNERGFFLMIEGGSVDWAGHANDAGTNLREVLGLDAAVREALAFAEARPNETLIIVTGDHETGGMSMGFAGTGYALYMDRLTNQTISVSEFGEAFKRRLAESPNLTFEEIKPFLTSSYGYGFVSSNEIARAKRLEKAAQQESAAANKRLDAIRKQLLKLSNPAEFARRYPNGAFGELPAGLVLPTTVEEAQTAAQAAKDEFLRLKAVQSSLSPNPLWLSDDEVAQLKTAFEHDVELSRADVKENEAYDAKKTYLFPAAAQLILSHKAGIGWSSGAHTAMPVVTTATGPSAERFSGYMENTQISENIKSFFSAE